MPIFGQPRITGQNLDPRVCFELWVELGTLEKARQELFRRGVKHPYSDDSYTIGGVRRAAFQWLLYHPQAGYERMSASVPGYTWEDFERWLVYRALSICQGETAFRKWLRSMGVYESQKYRDIYCAKYPRLHQHGESDPEPG